MVYKLNSSLKYLSTFASNFKEYIYNRLMITKLTLILFLSIDIILHLNIENSLDTGLWSENKFEELIKCTFLNRILGVVILSQIMPTK